MGKAVFELEDELGAGLGVKRDGRTEGKYRCQKIKCRTPKPT